MIKSSLEVKQISVVWESETLGDPLLLLGKERRNLSNNFDGDGEGIKTYAEYREWIRSSLPFLVLFFYLTSKKKNKKSLIPSLADNSIT